MLPSRHSSLPQKTRRVPSTRHIPPLYHPGRVAQCAQETSEIPHQPPHGFSYRESTRKVSARSRFALQRTGLLINRKRADSETHSVPSHHSSLADQSRSVPSTRHNPPLYHPSRVTQYIKEASETSYQPCHEFPYRESTWEYLQETVPLHHARIAGSTKNAPTRRHDFIDIKRSASRNTCNTLPPSIRELLNLRHARHLQPVFNSTCSPRFRVHNRMSLELCRLPTSPFF